MDIPERVDAVVIGGGVMGASVAHHLCRGGCSRVLLVDRERLFGSQSTGKCAGGVRHQFDSEINVKLSLLSLQMLARFESELAQPLATRRCGYLFVLTAERDLPEFHRQVQMQRKLGVRTEWLDGDEVRRRLPSFSFPDALAGTWGPDDGLADPAGVVQGYIRSARRLGARCLNDVEVLGIESTSGRISAVQTTAGRVHTPVVVNAAGAWAGRIGAMAGIEVPVTPVRRQIAVTTPVPALPPDLPFVIDFTHRLYFHREGAAVLTGMSKPDEPGGFVTTVDPAWELVHLEAACARMPLLEQVGVQSRWAGLYENSPDAQPILGATELTGFHCITGFSGHGFMHGPAAGLLVAEEILCGSARTLDISELRLSRFRQGRACTEYNVV